MATIDLENYRTRSGQIKSRVFTGRDKGASVRTNSKIDELFSNNSELIINIPNDIFSITPSFLEELFRNIVKTNGRDLVLQKVRFHGNYKIDGAFSEAINRILQQKTGLEV